jgi:heptosyltransferase II
MLLIIKIIGTLISILPVRLLELTSKLLGDVVYLCAGKRKTIALRNLHHCFPEKPESARRKILREHCRRFIEMGFFVIGSPFFSEKKARSILLTPEAEELEKMESAVYDKPCVLMVPHFTLSEAINYIPLRAPNTKGRVSVIFRPLNDPKLNKWVTDSRSRFGVELLSRRNGYSTALKRLEANKAVGILFDQNAAGKGSLIHFMDRIASSSELAGILAHRKKADAHVIYAERIGFWRARLRMEALDRGQHPIDLTLAANEWLADYLKSSDDHCADWLWLHDRWGSPQNPKRRFHLREKRNRLEEDERHRKGAPIVRRTSVWFYLPSDTAEWLDLPKILEEIRASRPDYALCLASDQTAETIQAQFGNLPDRVLDIQTARAAREKQLEAIAKEYPDVWINLRTDVESLKDSARTKAAQRYAIETLPDAEKYATNLSAAPTDSWQPFFYRFGLGTRAKHRKPKESPRSV